MNLRRFLLLLAVGTGSFIGGVSVYGYALAQSLPPDYWRQPLAAQGAPPTAWSPAEQSLNPKDCGACHNDKLNEWRTSLHAKAFSPGLVGQLLTYSPADAASCLQCHAPLAEQRQAFEAARAHGKGHMPDAQELAAAGNSCGGCHLRAYRRFGPPQRGTGEVGPSDTNGPHGGAFRTKDFETSDFCAVCHQFSQDQAINGKPLENTVTEWRTSPQAASGQSCQSCHMPDRRHLWRGIHDPATVASGLTPTVSASQDKAVFAVTNTGVGHAFPTYVTPKAVLHALLLDASGRPLPGSEKTYLIQRRVEAVGDDWREVSDTRLLPGQTASVELSWGTARRARAWLEVQPDDYYHSQTYAQLLKELPQNTIPRQLIEQADARTRASGYTLFTTEVERPR